MVTGKLCCMLYPSLSIVGWDICHCKTSRRSYYEIHIKMLLAWVFKVKKTMEVECLERSLFGKTNLYKY